MKSLLATVAAFALVGGTTMVAVAQPRQPQPFLAGQPVGAISQGVYTPLSDNVSVFGSLVSVKGCAYDSDRGLIVAASRGYGQAFIPNDGYVSLINHDGSVHTSKWIGVNRNGGLVLNEPLGSAIWNGTLYIADIDGGVRNRAGGPNTPTVSVIRMFSMETGAPTGSITTESSTGFNDIAVAADGTIYGVQSGPLGAYPPPETMRVYEIAPDGTQSVLIEGEPLSRPSGIAIDADGNLVIVNNQSAQSDGPPGRVRTDDILTFSRDGELLLTEDAGATGDAASLIVPGNIGIVVTADGTKYVSSNTTGVITRIRPGQAAETIASGIAGAWSMCFDTDANQLVVPMDGNALAFVPLE